MDAANNTLPGREQGEINSCLSRNLCQPGSWVESHE